MLAVQDSWQTLQARSQGGFEGVQTNPPCNLAKFIFNETTAVQGTIIQPCSGIVTDGIQAIMQLLQGVVTYTSPVEAFATGIKNFDRLIIIMRQKRCNYDVIIDRTPLMNN